ncbi:HhoA/HhoB/HtrA family serine endopeptidase [Lusitaniella coriacea]|uniref:HhoA/HhoB/HtrA family serine endopeptidase n=1 Tax=Lusitaniella coriacea TaxID=1983105 RepID=UPI003CEF0772
MRSSNFMRRLSTHLFALVFGVILAFGSLHVASSQADPAPQLRSTESANSIAQIAQNPTATRSRSNSFVAQAVAKTGPAVVRIDTERTISNPANPFMEDPFFREFFGDNFSRQMPQERQVQGQGSGFIVDREGFILTNAHVVAGAQSVTVTLQNGKVFPGEVRGTDEVTDLAVVKIDGKGKNLPVASLGDSGQVAVGDWAIAVGTPGGLDNTVTLGIISTLDRSSSAAGIPDKRVSFLQTDAAINPGNSGGPLLNDRGEVIGINTAIRANAMGIGFAIPINKAKDLKETLAAGKAVEHPFVGIQMVNLTPELARQNNDNPNSTVQIPEIEGVLVMRVLRGTPAERAGIRRGDVVTEVERQRVTSGEELQKIVENSGVGNNLRFKLQRGDRAMEITVQTEQLRNRS